MDTVKATINWLPLAEPGAYAPSTCEWSPDKPWDVTITFHVIPEETTWVIGRELFLSALGGVFTGERDVRMSVKQDAFYLELSSPFGEVVLRTQVEDVSNFINLTCVVVPQGSETALLPLDDDTLSAMLEEWKNL